MTESGWFDYLKQGLSHRPSGDRLADTASAGPLLVELQNLRPFLLRHWRAGLVGAALVLFTSLIALPSPLIIRYLIDTVILDRRLGLVAVTVLVLAAVKVLERLAGALQNFHFTRFEQNVVLEIQGALLDRTLRLPKAFFDEQANSLKSVY